MARPGGIDDMLFLFRHLVTQNPDSAFVHHTVATLEILEATRSRRDPASEAAVQRATVAARRAVELGESPAEMHRAGGEMMFRLGYFEAACERFELGLESAPLDVALHRRLVESSIRAGDWVGAILAVDRSPPLPELEEFSRSTLAEGFLETGDPTSARENFAALSSESSGFRDAGLALAAARVGRTAEAASALVAALRSKTPTEKSLRWMIEAAEIISRVDPGAAGHLAVAADLYLAGGGRDADLCARLASLPPVSADPSLTRRLLEIACAGRPDDLELTRALGAACLADGDAGRAVKLLSDSLKKGRSPESARVLGEAYAQLGRAREAADAWWTVIAPRDGKSPQIEDPEALRLETGRIYFRSGRLDRARALFRAVIEENPASAEAHAFLARLCLALKKPDLDAAREHAIAARDLGADAAIHGDLVAKVEEARVAGARAKHASATPPASPDEAASPGTPEPVAQAPTATSPEPPTTAPLAPICPIGPIAPKPFPTVEVRHGLGLLRGRLLGRSETGIPIVDIAGTHHWIEHVDVPRSSPLDEIDAAHRVPLTDAMKTRLAELLDAPRENLPTASAFTAALEARGHDWFLAGSAANRVLLGDAAPIPNDLDILHDAVPSVAQAVAEEVAPGAISSDYRARFHGTVSVGRRKGGVDLVSLYQAGDHANVVQVPGRGWKLSIAFGSSLVRDHQRRDFTFNGLLVSAKGGCLVDISGRGVADAQNGDIRLISDASITSNRDLALRFFKYRLRGLHADEETRSKITLNFHHFYGPETTVSPGQIARLAPADLTPQHLLAWLDRFTQQMVRDGLGEAELRCLPAAERVLRAYRSDRDYDARQASHHVERASRHVLA